MPTKADLTTQERSCKEGAVGAGGTSGVKMVLTLLTKVVVLHMRLTIEEVREMRFQKTSAGTILAAWIQAVGLGLEERVNLLPPQVTESLIENNLLSGIKDTVN